jgi:hypothetical protein
LPIAIVTLLGEVDCGFIFWRRHERNGVPLEELVDGAVGNYRELVAAAQQVAPVAVVSAPLPTLVDMAEIGDYASARREIRASRADRTAVARLLNERCGVMASDLGATFVDLDPDSLGPDGEVNGILMSPDPHDHHYDPVVYARLLQRHLAPVLGYELPGGRLPAPKGE